MEEHRNYNVGESNYSKHKYQVWDIWRDFKLNPWEADIVKRILRKKAGEENDPKKIIHILKEMTYQNEYEWNKAKTLFQLIVQEYNLTDEMKDILDIFLLNRFLFNELVLTAILRRMENL